MTKVYFRVLMSVITTLYGVVAQAASTSSIARLDPALDRLVSSDASIESLYSGNAGDSFEGPVWMRSPRPGYLIFANVTGNLFYKWTPEGKLSVFLDHIFTGDPSTAYHAGSRVMIGANGATLDRQGRLVYTSYSAGEIVRLEKDGKRTMLASHFGGKRINAPNDVIVKSDGSIYFTDSRAASEQATGPNCDKFWMLCGNKAGIPHKGVYFIKEGTVRLFSQTVDHPNGLALSKNESYLYISNSYEKNILRFAMQPDGTGTNEQVFVDMSSGRGEGLPDGIKVDTEDNVYCTGPGGIWIMSSAGRHLGTILTPERPTNFAFGGRDAKTLYIVGLKTLSRISLKVAGLRQ